MSGPLLITGAAGYLGRRLLSLAMDDPRWERVVGAVHRTPLVAGESLPMDLADPRSVQAGLDQLRPAAIIHAGAIIAPWANVRSDRDFWATNVEGSAALAAWAARQGTRLVHVSSDAIWGGREAAYTEQDVPAPITPYGASKAAGEAVVQALDPAAAIARTSLIYGFDPPDLNTIMALELLDGQRSGALFTDEFRCPVYVDDLARALLELARNSAAGVFHLVGPRIMSRYELGAALVRWHGRDPGPLPAGPTSASGLRRPSRVVVDNAATQAQLTTTLRDIDMVMSQEVRYGAHSGGHR
jgi:dTDP-4-dehydrorhamnose reductase